MNSFRGRLGFCSNFADCLHGVTLDDVTYPTAEHAYACLKVGGPGTPAGQDVLGCATPGGAKRTARRYPEAAGWFHDKVPTMRRILRAKFTQNDGLKKQLLATGKETLVEVNEWGDRFWGQSPEGVGKNHLGRLLMEIRAELATNP